MIERIIRGKYLGKTESDFPRQRRKWVSKINIVGFGLWFFEAKEERHLLPLETEIRLIWEKVFHEKSSGERGKSFSVFLRSSDVIGNWVPRQISSAGKKEGREERHLTGCLSELPRDRKLFPHLLDVCVFPFRAHLCFNFPSGLPIPFSALAKRSVKLTRNMRLRISPFPWSENVPNVEKEGFNALNPAELQTPT